MSNSIDHQFVEFVVKSLVSRPDAVVIERRIDEKGVLLELTVDPEDLGRVIGKRGATAQSIRTLLRALGTKNDARYNLKIIDNGPERVGGGREDSSSQSSGGLWGNDNSSSVDEQTKEVVEAATSSIDEPEKPQEEKSDAFSRTRKELADLDDLDV